MVVEDQLLIAMDLVEMLEQMGLAVLATVTSPQEAMALLRVDTPDLAILDVNLGDATSEPIAHQLTKMGVPFVFATGYADDGAVPAAFDDVPVVRKPYDRASLEHGLQTLLQVQSRRV
jgi:two-component SAPR family response regulator